MGFSEFFDSMVLKNGGDGINGERGRGLGRGRGWKKSRNIINEGRRNELHIDKYCIHRGLVHLTQIEKGNISKCKKNTGGSRQVSKN